MKTKKNNYKIPIQWSIKKIHIEMNERRQFTFFFNSKHTVLFYIHNMLAYKQNIFSIISNVLVCVCACVSCDIHFTCKQKKEAFVIYTTNFFPPLFWYVVAIKLWIFVCNVLLKWNSVSILFERVERECKTMDSHGE